VDFQKIHVMTQKVILPEFLTVKMRIADRKDNNVFFERELKKTEFTVQTLADGRSEIIMGHKSLCDDVELGDRYFITVQVGARLSGKVLNPEEGLPTQTNSAQVKIPDLPPTN